MQEMRRTLSKLTALSAVVLLSVFLASCEEPDNSEETAAPRQWTWDAVRTDIQASPLYRRLSVPVQEGLVPLGPDPTSKLQEFALSNSGVIPKRSASSGRLLQVDAGAIVFVLLPGAECWLGAQCKDEGARNYDPWATDLEAPVHGATLSPFFLSKYECTVCQWTHLGGSGSGLPENRARYPVTQLAHAEVLDVLRKHGLDLPSEAQWEYACRGGTSTVWWSGNAEADLKRVGWYRGNLPPSDRVPRFIPIHEVGTKPANALGLHDVHGGVWEWCLDELLPYSTTTPREDPLVVGAGPNCVHVIRGGGQWDEAASTRSASRSGVLGTGKSTGLGFRPARAVAGGGAD